MVLVGWPPLWGARATRVLPSGEKARRKTGTFAWKRRFSLPVAASRRRTFHFALGLWKLVVARVLPSGDRATAMTMSASSNRRSSFPLAMFQNRTVLSWLPEIRVRPSGAHASDRTQLE